MDYPIKFPRTLVWPNSPSVPKSDRVMSDPFTFVETDVVITEKLDGSNCSLWGGEVYARGGTIPSVAPWDCMAKKHHAWKTKQLSKNLVFFCENLYGVHAIKYDAMAEEDTLKLFAVYDMNAKEFASWKRVVEYSDMLGITTVPVLFKGRFSNINSISEWFDDNITALSNIGPTPEGFIMRYSGVISKYSKSVVKYVRENHVQPDARHWRHHWEPCEILMEEDA